jgi:hypothetical protein
MDEDSQRRALLLEARKLRNLGRYPEAEEKFREAIASHDEVDLEVELASMFSEQGRVRQCYDHLSILATRSALSPAGSMLLCVASAGVSVQFTENLRTAIALFNKHLKDREPEDYEKLHVRISP